MFCYGLYAGLKLLILLLQCPECWDYRHVLSYSAENQKLPSAEWSHKQKILYLTSCDRLRVKTQIC